MNRSPGESHTVFGHTLPGNSILYLFYFIPNSVWPQGHDSPGEQVHARLGVHRGPVVLACTHVCVCVCVCVSVDCVRVCVCVRACVCA